MKIDFRQNLFIATVTLLLFSSPAWANSDVARFFVQKAQTHQIKIMSFNTLNLYDTKHDSGYFDYTFLPKSFPTKTKECGTLSSDYYRNLCKNLNWNNQKLQQKIAQIKKALKAHGSLPDILALQEVENRNVVGKLARALGYKKFLVTDQPSKRGIDVALLWNEEKLNYQDHLEIPATLRDPLRVEFEMANSGDSLFVYVNHWPAQSAPTSWRVQSAKAVKKDLNRLMRYQKDAKVVMLGDFNVRSDEDQTVFGKNLTGYRLKNRMYDLHQLSKKQFPKMHKKFPKGTYWRRGTTDWNRFDRILVNKNLIDDQSYVDVESYRILFSKLLTKTEKIESDASKSVRLRVPKGYNFLQEKGQPLGYSDHLPVSAIINDGE